MSERIDKLAQRIRVIEEELSIVKTELKDLEEITADTTITPKNEQLKKVHPPAARALGMKPYQNGKRSKEEVHIEDLVSEWLPRIFIFVFILGIIWAFIAASEHGWINPVFKVLSGFILTALINVVGNRQYKNGRLNLGLVLNGGSIVVYIVSVFAGNVLYDLIPYSLTILLLAVGIIFGIWLSRKYHSELLLGIVGVGAYLYPFLFAGEQNNEYIFYIYETLVFFGLSFESIKKNFRVVWNISVYASFFAVLFFLAFGVSGISTATLTAIAVQHLIIVFLASKRVFSLSKNLSIPAISAGAIFVYYLGSDRFIQGFDYHLFLLITALIYFVFCFLDSWFAKELRSLFFTFSMFYTSMLILSLLSEKGVIVALIIQAIIVYFVSERRKSILGIVVSALIFVPNVFFLISQTPYQFHIVDLISWLLTISFVAWVYINRKDAKVTSPYLITNIAPYFISFLTLILFSKMAIYLTKDDESMFSAIGMSFSWMLFVGISYGLYSFFKEVHWKYIGLTLLILTLVKITLIDLVSISLIWKAILFILMGLIGLIVSRIFYNKNAK